MTKKLQTSKDAAEKVVKNIRRKTREAFMISPNTTKFGS